MRLPTKNTYYYTLTLHNCSDYSFAHLNLLLRSYFKCEIMYICEHFGDDLNGIEITSHAHLIIKTDSLIDDFNYNDIITYLSLLEKVSDVRNMYNYTKNGHCEFEVIYNRLELYFTEKLTLNDLFNELYQFYITKSFDDYVEDNENYLLEKYGVLWVNNRSKLIRAFHCAERSSYNVKRKKMNQYEK